MISTKSNHKFQAFSTKDNMLKKNCDISNNQLSIPKIDVFEERIGIVGKKIESILDSRLKVRKKVAKRDAIDQIHRFAILEHPVITNRMYLKLLSGEMTNSALQFFFSNYYHASCRGFCCVVLPRALHAHKDKEWRSYIKAMIQEEKTPSSHFLLLKKFIESCGFCIEEPSVAQRFIDSMIKGYTSNIPFALGYSLAVEVEGAYQIDLIEQSCEHIFAKPLEQTIWFKIHLSSTGEEEHANMAIDVIENLVNSEQDIEDLRQGFLQGCNDTCDFLESIYDSIYVN